MNNCTRCNKMMNLICSGRKLLAVASVSLWVMPTIANVVYLNNSSAVVNYGEDTRLTDKIGSNNRILIHQGTVNVNDGAIIHVGGTSAGVCNFVGVDCENPGRLNINGGTVWCTTSGGGSGYLGVGNNNDGVTSTLTLNAGVFKVDKVLRSGVMWNDTAGATSSGEITINGGEATVETILMGATTVNTGVSKLTLNGGTLAVNNIKFRTGNGQEFYWLRGTIVAKSANVFQLEEYNSANTKKRIMKIEGWPATFDTAGFDQSIPAFTGEGALRLTGGGKVKFESSSVSHSIMPDGVTVDIGTLDGSAAPLTVRSLEIIRPFTLAVTLPGSPTGRYPLISTTEGIVGSVAQITVVGGGEGVLVRDNDTIYLSFDGDDALVYSNADGGAATPDKSEYSRLSFTDAAGSYTVGGNGLTLSYDISAASTKPQTITAPITFSGIKYPSVYVADGGKLTLSGDVTSSEEYLVKDGKGTLVLAGATLPNIITPAEGVIDFGGDTYDGFIKTDWRYFDGEMIVLTNGVWRPSAAQKEVDVWANGNSIIVADGFTCDLTAKERNRVAVGYIYNKGTGLDTALIIDGGTFKTIGNSSTKCNFVGVDTHGRFLLEVKRGKFEDQGWLRIAAGSSPKTGIVRVSGGLFSVAKDLTMGSVYNGTNGAIGNGVFEQSGGTASVGVFYVGNSSSTHNSSSTVKLTGGVLEVGTLKCLGCNRQTILVDGGTIRAKGDASVSAPFMTALPSVDSAKKSYTIGVRGLTIDTAGYDVNCDIPWTGEGGITVFGEGGSLLLEEKFTCGGDITVADNVTLVITNNFELSGKVVFAGSHAKLKFDLSNYLNDTLTFTTGGFDLPDGVESVLDLLDVTSTYVAKLSDDGKTIVFSLSANVAAYAWWTGAANDGDIGNVANWACTNNVGAAVEGALPVKATDVFIDGTTSFTIAPGTTPFWVKTLIGKGGEVKLAADCDWSALHNVTLADGATLDLAGYDLKVSELIAEDGEKCVIITNSVEGTKSMLWTEDKFAESEWIDTEKINVYTDVVEVKSVNGKGVSTTIRQFASAFDVGLSVTSGVTTVRGGDCNLGVNGNRATIEISKSAKMEFRDGNVHCGFEGDSSAYVSISDSAILNIQNAMLVGYSNSGTSLFLQCGGTVNVSTQLAIGKEKNSNVARYEMTGGILTVGGSLVPGRESGRGEFIQGGGTVNANSYLTIAYNGDGVYGAYIITNGTLNVPNRQITVAEQSSESSTNIGLLEISGGMVNSAKGVIIGKHEKTQGTMRLLDDGRISAPFIHAACSQSTLEFDGGTLVAAPRADETIVSPEWNFTEKTFVNNIKNIRFKSRSVKLDTAGRNIAFEKCTLKVTPNKSAIVLSGDGSLDFTDTTMEFIEQPVKSFVFAKVEEGSNATFVGVPTLADSVKGCEVILSEDRKTIRIKRNRFVIILR